MGWVRSGGRYQLALVQPLDPICPGHTLNQINDLSATSDLSVTSNIFATYNLSDIN